MHLTKSDLKAIKGRLQVRAKVDTRRGLSEDVVVAGTLGWVMGHRVSDQTYIILWDRPRSYSSDNRCSSHPVGVVEPTGQRG
jgi:hypothetical protein